MPPTTIFLLGGTAPFLPNTVAGTIAGRAKTAPAWAADLRKYRRVTLVFHMLMFSWAVTLVHSLAGDSDAGGRMPRDAY